MNDVLHSLPASPQDITPLLLTTLLRQGQVLSQERVTTLSVTPLGVLASYNAQLARLSVAYSESTYSAPSSYIIKLSPPAVNLNQHVTILQPGTKEGWFYRSAAQYTPIPVPRCYLNLIEHDTQRSLLLLEDLAPAITGNQITGVSIDDAKPVLALLANLHSTWWAQHNTDEIHELRDLTTQTDDISRLVRQWYRAAWPRFVAQSPAGLTDTVRQFGTALCAGTSRTDTLLDAAPHTLLHGDFRLENMLFRHQHGSTTWWVIDWEDIGLGNAMSDVAWFIGGCVQIESPMGEQALLQHYYAALVTMGVQQYSWEQCQRDYRMAMCNCFVQGILTATAVGERDTHRSALGVVVGQRFIAACTRLRLWEFYL